MLAASRRLHQSHITLRWLYIVRYAAMRDAFDARYCRLMQPRSFRDYTLYYFHYFRH